MARGTEISATVPPIEQLGRELPVHYDRRAPKLHDRRVRLGPHPAPLANHDWRAGVADLARPARCSRRGRPLEAGRGSGFWTRHRTRQVLYAPESPAARLRCRSRKAATCTVGRVFALGRDRTARS